MKEKKEIIMSRSVWKGPFVDPSLLKKVEKLKMQPNPTPIKMRAKRTFSQIFSLIFDVYKHKSKKLKSRSLP